MGQGQVFQRTYTGKDGTLKTCNTWTIRWYRNGRPYEESTRYTQKDDAVNLLKLRNGDVASGNPGVRRFFQNAATLGIPLFLSAVTIGEPRQGGETGAPSW